MIRSAFRSRTLVGLVAACAALAVAPAVAVGKATKYEGPIAAEPHPSEPEVLIRFKVRYDKKGKPEELFPLEIKGVREYCENGSSLGIGGGYGSGWALWGNASVLVKKRKFADVQQVGLDHEDTWSISGRVPRNGDATGVLQIVERIGTGDEDIAQYGTCDTGVLSWTATRVG
jgi:hypothetical protein